MKTKDNIVDVAIMYCCDRDSFTAQYGDTLHKDYLDMLMLNTTTRPDLAESIPIKILGYRGKDKKHGYDGYDDTRSRPIEGKIRMTTTIDGKVPPTLTAITINDPSESIFEKYENDNPEFLFAFFINGFLVVCFSVEWSTLKPLYRSGIDNIKKAGNGRRNFSVTPKWWIDECSVSWVNPNPDVIKLLPKVLANKLKKISQAVI
jgi:hypothetical protein